MAFHAHNGWFFKRLADGTVRLFHQAPGAEVDQDLTFNTWAWASIVASVSARSETGETFAAALQLHNRT